MSIGESFPQVLEAARTGAEWAWTAIYRDLAPAVLGYLRTRGAPDPEDATGEVFLGVVRGLRSFEGNEDEFRSWVFVIAHRRLIDERRRLHRRPAHADEDEELEEVASADDVEAEAITRLGTARVRRIIDRLTEDQRDVLLLRLIGGFTVDEVAQVVGKRPGAVKALQRRGLAAIARELAKEGVPH